MNSGTSFLDLLCNGIGAMLLLFVLISTKHLVRPEIAERGILVIEAVSEAQDVQLGIWVKQGSTGKYLVNEEIVALNEKQRDVTVRQQAARLNDRAQTKNAFLMQVGSGSAGLKSNSAVVAIVDPIRDCYRVGVFVGDRSGPPADWDRQTQVGLKIWFKSAIEGQWSRLKSDSIPTQSDPHYVNRPGSYIELPISVPKDLPRDCK